MKSTWTTIDSLAGELGVKVPARRMWKLRGSVPWKWHGRLLRAARERGIPLSEDDLLLTTNLNSDMPTPSHFAPDKS